MEDNAKEEIARRVPRQSPENVAEIIATRQGTHGVFKENTVPMQAMKDLMRAQPNWRQLEPYMREALDMLAHKVGRILHGDPKFEEHWVDISGYCDRVAKTIRGDLSP